MTINLGSIPTQVIIQGTTNLDVSQALISLSISGNALDDSGWFKPRGQVVLGVLPGFSESFDCRVNPGRWAPGTIVAVSVWFGAWIPLPWRLRILAYPNRPMPGSRTITLEVGTDADLLNYRAPEGDPGNDEYGTPTGAQTLINRALSKAGAPPLVTGTAITTLNLPFSPEKNTGGSWISYAGSVAYSARYILWQRTDGGIVATPLTLDGLTPAATYTVGTDEADYVLSAPGEQPPELVEVQGTTYLIEDATPEGTDVTEEINGVLTRTRVEFEDWETDDQKIIETVWIPLELIAPPQFAGNSGPSILKITTTTRSYDTWGRLTQTVVEVQQPLFILGRSNNNQVLWPFTRITTTNEYPLSFPEPEIASLIKTRELITKRTTREQVLPPDSLNLIDRLVTVESWEEKKAGQYLYQRNVTDMSEDALRVQAQPSAPRFEPPPATEFKPATKQRTEVSRRGQARFTNAVGSSFAEKKWIIQLPSGMAGTNTDCNAHAQLWGRIRQGRQFQISWAGDLVASWLTNFSPVRRVDFTLNGITTAYLIEAFNLQIDQRSAAVGGLGLELGIVSGGSVAPPYVAIPQFAGAGILQIAATGSVEVAPTLEGAGVIQVFATGSIEVTL